MKKLRLTKITIRMKETILRSEKITRTERALSCPVCRASFSAAELLRAVAEHDPPPAKNLPVGETGENE